jgi:hypothetical protein
LHFWLSALAFWSALSLANGLVVLTDLARRGEATAPGTVLLAYWIGFLPWVAATAAVFWLVERRPLRREDWFPTLGGYVGLALVFLTIYLPWDALVTLRFFEPDLGFLAALYRLGAQVAFLNGLLLFGLFGVANAVFASRQARERAHRLTALALENARLSVELSETHLVMLRAQLEPHFFFNALNAVTGLIRSGRHADAITALARLSDLLRYATEALGRDAVTIGEEVDFCEQYLHFHQLRFGERLSYSVDVDEGLEGVWVLPLVLQPLVENAIHHGVERHDAPSVVRLGVVGGANNLVVTIENRPGGEDPTRGMGVGLANLRRRLDAHCGAGYRLAGTTQDGAYTTTLELHHRG